MIRRQTLLFLSIAAILDLATGVSVKAQNWPGAQTDHRSRVERVHAQGSTLAEEIPTATVVMPTEAPAAFNNQSNGFDVQGADYSTLSASSFRRCVPSTTTASCSRK
jgi:hypothetical protein